DPGFYNRWQQTHLDIILRQDVLEAEAIKSIKQIETLTLMLTERVASPLSYNALKEDLSTDDKSIKRWVDILENSYVLFRVFPYTNRSFIHGIKKSPKIYFYDYCRVDNNANRLENLVALSLMKEIYFRRDCKGEVFGLNYIRNKQGNEIDFLITKKKKPHMLIEVKESDSEPSPNFKSFEKYVPGVQKVQLVKNLERGFTNKEGISVLPMASWLATMNF
ncbi:MAG: DUF4143 domain-containing protein, partial [Bdellovibrionales bacterium]